ncbi:MAG: hypothetical protein OSA93_04710 [Akkermansiaceae bacterium]|nr:hypothetical protein [Akkermansiaceae bacterium]
MPEPFQHIIVRFQPHELVVVKIDQFFDHKWLAFLGKARGAIGI